MKRTLKYYPGCTTDLEWMRDFSESVRYYWIERFKEKETVMVKRQWEYKRVLCRTSNYDQILNKDGAEGWEAYSVLDSGSSGEMEIHFKRPLAEKQLLNE